MFRTLALTLIFALAMQAAITYSYDAAGRLTKVNYGDGRVITYSYDAAGNLVKRQVTTTAPKPQSKAGNAQR